MPFTISTKRGPPRRTRPYADCTAAVDRRPSRHPGVDSRALRDGRGMSGPQQIVMMDREPLDMLRGQAATEHRHEFLLRSRVGTAVDAPQESPSSRSLLTQ